MPASGVEDVQLVHFVLRDIVAMLDQAIAVAVQHKERAAAFPEAAETPSQHATFQRITDRILFLLREPVAAQALFAAMQKYSEAPIGAILKQICAEILREDFQITAGDDSRSSDIEIAVHTFFALLSANAPKPPSADETRKTALAAHFLDKYHLRTDGQPACAYSADSTHQRAMQTLFRHFGAPACLAKHRIPADSLCVVSEQSYFHHLGQSLSESRLYDVDKLRLLAFHSPNSAKLPAEYRLVSTGRLREPRALAERTNEPLEAMQRIIAEVVRSASVQSWQIGELRRLQDACGDALLSGEVLQDPLFLLVLASAAFAAYIAGRADSVELRFLLEVAAGITSSCDAEEADKRLFLLYGLFYWFFAMLPSGTFPLHRIVHSAVHRSLGAVHEHDRLTRAMLLAEPFVGCCRVHPGLFSYLHSATEWADFAKDTEESAFPQAALPADVMANVREGVLHIASLAAIEALQLPVTQFFVKALEWYAAFLTAFPSANASAAVHVGCTALAGLALCVKTPMPAGVAYAVTDVVDALVTLASTRSEFSFVKQPSGPLSAWLYEICVYVGLTAGSAGLQERFVQWFGEVYAAIVG